MDVHGLSVQGFSSTSAEAKGGSREITITRPDDWHLHVRDGAGLRSVVPHSARVFKRAIIMPNLVPPVTTADMVGEFYEKIICSKR